MDRKDLLRKVRRIEIKTRRAANDVLAGQYHSNFRGHGMTFSEVREYQYGDDIRDIDWNVTARMGRPYVKVYEEDRDLTLMLLIDVSNSMLMGTKGETCGEFACQIAATIAFSALQNGDNVGALFFADKVIEYIPPASGRKHLLRILSRLLECHSEETSTDIGGALSYLMKIQRRSAVVFLLSDMIASRPYEQELKLAGRRYDMNAIAVSDSFTESLPDVGLLRVRDLETGHMAWVDTASRSARMVGKMWQQHQSKVSNAMAGAGVRCAFVRNNEDFMIPLIGLFNRRI